MPFPWGHAHPWPAAGSAGATTLSTPQIPSHSHNIQRGSYDGNPALINVSTGRDFLGTTAVTSTGGGGSHTHPFSFSSGSGTFSGNAINLAVKYVDVIRATKN